MGSLDSLLVQLSIKLFHPLLCFCIYFIRDVTKIGKNRLGLDRTLFLVLGEDIARDENFLLDEATSDFCVESAMAVVAKLGKDKGEMVPLHPKLTHIDTLMRVGKKVVEGSIPDEYLPLKREDFKEGVAGGGLIVTPLFGGNRDDT